MRNYYQGPQKYNRNQPSVRQQRKALLTLIGIFALIALIVIGVNAVRGGKQDSTSNNHYSIISTNAPETPVLNTLMPTEEPEEIVTPEPTEEPTATPEPTPSPTPLPDMEHTLRPGDSGTAVQQMQERLIELGYLSGNADGKYGNNTKKAVRSFQKRNGLTDDGVAGKKTLTALYSSDAKAAK